MVPFACEAEGEAVPARNEWRPAAGEVDSGHGARVFGTFPERVPALRVRNVPVPWPAQGTCTERKEQAASLGESWLWRCRCDDVDVRHRRIPVWLKRKTLGRTKNKVLWVFGVYA